MQKDLVRQGYNKAASSYLAERGQLGSGKYVQKLLKLLKKNSSILDLGCGAGIPVDDMILDAGHNLLGIDISEEMITLARRNCPAGEYRVGDLEKLREGEYSVDAVVSFYALFHIPRSLHGKVLKTIGSFLPKGGLMLITMGDKDFEGKTIFYNHPMWWSQWGPSKNRELVKQAGFEMLLDQIDRTGSENHQIIMAEKK